MYDCRYANTQGRLVYQKNTGEESSFSVYCVDGDFILFGVPMYGGEEKFEGVYDTLQDAIDDAESWT